MQREDPDASILTREDVGYGPGRPYEYVGPAMPRPRERRARATRRPRGAAPKPPGEGPYYERLLRRRRPDRWIYAEVEEILFQDTWVDADRITVGVRDGVVTLTGTLSERREARAAIRDAYRAAGVERVRNHLEVEP